jgi:hypothetical protein
LLRAGHAFRVVTIPVSASVTVRNWLCLVIFKLPIWRQPAAMV